MFFKCTTFVLIVLVFQFCSAGDETCEKPKHHKLSKRKLYNSPNAPAVRGPYSHAAVYNGEEIYISMMEGVNPKTGEYPETFAEEAEQALKNGLTVLKELGGSKENVLKLRNYMMNMTNLEELNEAYKKVFNGQYPVQSTIQVVDLPTCAQVYIDIIARLDKRHKPHLSF